MTSPYPTPEVELHDMRIHSRGYEAVLIAARDAHAVLDIVLNAADPAAARRAIADRYDFTDRQARAVMDVELHRLTASELERIQQRRRQLDRRIASLEQELSSDPQ